MSDRWQQIESILDTALQAPPPDRSELLQRLCGSDPEIRREVESLLAAHAESEGFLSTSAESFAAPFVAAAAARESSEQPGLIVGRYRLLEEIGRGGMGRVWLAERSDGQFEQRVALKLVKRGMDTEEILARFRRERQILARLEHPNVARLIDGGVSEDGRPYFVMEYVAGTALTVHCDSRNLPVEDRLRLFVEVARTVGFAHRNLVVHRDIKPSNVLVDEQGRVKLLDFGIARLLGDEDDARTVTAAGRLMTPEYASPEQVAGRHATTASDVYQLGVLLHELLTRQRPVQAGSDTSGPIRRPSSTVRRTAAGNERLQRQLKGDLDTIVLRAVREEPEWRYPSAEELAEDVERHLAHLPIRFGGDRAWYRVGKFVRRHRLGVSAGAVILVFTLGLLGFDMVRVRRERDRARHEADKAIEVAQLMAQFLQGWSPDASDRGEVSARKLLGDAVIRAERELAERPEMLAATLSLLGDFHTTLGEWRMAESLLARALRLQAGEGDGSSADHAATLLRRGRLYRFTGRYAEAVAPLEAAIATSSAVFGPHHPETLRAQRELATNYRFWKKPREAEALLRSVLGSLDDSTRNSSPFALEAASELGHALLYQARNLEAIAVLRPTLERQRAIFGAVHLATLSTLRSLGSALRDHGELAEAEALYREALRVTRALYGAEHHETQGSLFVLALLLERRANFAEAEELARQAFELHVKIYGADHSAVWYGHGHLGALRLERGDPAEAERLLRLGLAESRRAVPRGDPDQADLLNRLAYLLVQRDAPDADVIYREAVAFDEDRSPGQPDFVTDGVHFLAWTQHRRGDLQRAEATYRRALRIYERQLPADHPHRVAAAQGLGAVLGDLRRGQRTP